jgi:hypothetical protein
MTALNSRSQSPGSPVREPPLDLSKEGCTPLGRRMIHTVVREIVAAGARHADPTHGARQEATWWTAHHEHQPSPAAIGANDAETLDVMKTGIVGSVLA